MSIEPIRSELLPGEQILWTGQPRRDILFSMSDLFLVPFSLMWFGFAVFWEAAAIRENGDWFFVLWGIPFILFGGYFVAGRFIYKRWRKEHTYYAVTDRRVLAVTEGRRRAVQADFIGAVPAINKSIRRDGVGTLRFGGASLWGFYGNTGMEFMGSWPGMQQATTFYDIDDADQVYRLVSRQRGPGSM